MKSGAEELDSLAVILDLSMSLLPVKGPDILQEG